jgi:hypothetical protein
MKYTICSQHYSGNLPKWFKTKYDDKLLFPDGLLIVSKAERIFINDFFKDYKKAISESGFWDDGTGLSITIAALNEDGGINKIIISEKTIKFYNQYENT